MEAQNIAHERRSKRRTRLQMQPGGIRALVGSHVLAAELYDLSPCGVGLLVEQRIEPGRMVIVEVFNAANNWWELKTTGAMHCTRQSDGRWLVGCSFFRRFTETEFTAVLGKAADQPSLIPAL